MSEGLRRWKPQPGTVLGIVAIFIALAGSAYAAQKIGKNKVKSKHIKDGQVFSVDVADLGIATVDLADGSVTTAKIGDNAVNSAKVAADSLAANDLANNAVGTGELADNAVTNPKVADNAIANAELADNAVTTNEVAADTLTAGDIGTGQVTSTELADNIINAEDLDDLHTHAGTAVNIAAGVDNNGVFNSAVGSAACAAGEDLYGYSIQWTTTDGSEQVQLDDITPNFATDTVAIRAGTDEGTGESFQAVAWCTL